MVIDINRMKKSRINVLQLNKDVVAKVEGLDPEGIKAYLEPNKDSGQGWMIRVVGHPGDNGSEKLKKLSQVICNDLGLSKKTWDQLVQEKPHCTIQSVGRMSLPAH